MEVVVVKVVVVFLEGGEVVFFGSSCWCLFCRDYVLQDSWCVNWLQCYLVEIKDVIIIIFQIVFSDCLNKYCFERKDFFF